MPAITQTNEPKNIWLFSMLGKNPTKIHAEEAIQNLFRNIKIANINS